VYILIMLLDKNIVNLSNFNGRGVQTPINNGLSKHHLEHFWNGSYFDEEFFMADEKTKYIPTHPKTILNRINNPDMVPEWSMNPYQGCEHGCVYCYARITHEYWGYNAGLDFEKNILYKSNAAELLEHKLKSKSWKGEKITISGNTDCYQPAEQKLKITRQLLEICLKYNQSVEIITKNALVCRDIDILEKMAAKGLVEVCISITTLNEDLRRTLEPRTSSSKNKLKVVRTLSDHEIPVGVLFAPIIPGLNSDEIFKICEAVSNAGASFLNYTILRLNGTTALLFENWIHKTFPLRASRVLHQIAEAQGGNLNKDSSNRRKKSSAVAQTIHQQVRLAKNKYQLNKVKQKAAPQKLGIKQTPQLNLF
jgi:DNA repair photolyase